jgi:large subunit ribosomal protein L2
LDSFKNVGYRCSKKSLLSRINRTGGRNNQGRITCRHRGGGNKRLYRKVDFWRKKLNILGYIQTIEYDPNRNARIALVHYVDGEKSYILAPKDILVGNPIITGFNISTEVGNSLPLWNIPLGISLHNVELHPRSGGKIARSAGTRVQLMARENGVVTLRLPSGEIRLVSQTRWATVGQVGNVDVSNKKIGKAGRIRWLGWRPTVRGSVINPVDHPHGGGEGRCTIGRICPFTPWGKLRLGVKTRRWKKRKQVFILRRRV